MKLDNASYILVIVVGLLIAGAVFLKLVFGFNIDSDWFWLLAGLGVAAEGIISLSKQKMFARKYKVIRRV
jgi:hypothetical protein